MKRLTIVFFSVALVLIATGFGPKDKPYIRSIKKHRKSLHKAFKNPETSPFKDQASSYKRLDYYAPNPSYRVTAELRKTPEADPFQMPTSNPDRDKQFVSYGTLHFELNGQAYQLTAYRNLELPGIPKYQRHLFVPFTDLTTGRETYGGGRYIDLEIPESGNEILLDFNFCYNPYCAYGDGWSCPIPPKENFLDTRIEAGVKKYHE